MSGIRASIVFALALRGLACSDWCPHLLPDICHQNQFEGGCCGEDGFRDTTGNCSSCTAQGNSYDWMCSICNMDSKCNGLNRAAALDAECTAADCRGGCLMNGECTYTVTQEACNLDRKTWCQACSLDVWNICAPWADCYAVCTGCCTTTDGKCPEAPYEMRSDGPCAPCEMRPEMCEACFPETICSASYDATKYNLTMSQKFAAFEKRDEEVEAAAEATASPTAYPTASPTTEAPTQAPTAAPTNASTTEVFMSTSEPSEPQEDESISFGARTTDRILILSVLAPGLLCVM